MADTAFFLGQFPAPGPNRQPIPAMHGNPGFPGAPGFQGGPGFPAAAGAAMGGVGNPVRQSKRLYVGNVQLTCNESALAEFFNSKMREQGFAVEMPGEPVTSVQLNHEKSYAFVEVSTTFSPRRNLTYRRSSFSSECQKKLPLRWLSTVSSVCKFFCSCPFNQLTSRPLYHSPSGATQNPSSEG